MAFGRCPGPRRIEQRRDVVGRRDIAPAARGRECGIAVARGDIEDAAAGAHVERFAQILADDLQRGSHDRVVAGRPRGLLARLDRHKIDRGRGR